MPECRGCGEVIFFAWDANPKRWIPCELESLSGDETEYGDNAVLYESHHRRHRCAARIPQPKRWKPGARPPSPPFPPPPPPSPARRRPPPPPPPPPRVVAANTFAHATLHLLPSAPIEVIRAAYRALAGIHHPDVGGSAEKMAQINAAYDQLSGKK